MRIVRTTSVKGVVAVLAVVLMTLFTAAAAAQNSPVSVEVTGDAVPGGTVTATVSLTDGSTLQGVTWSQVSGATASLSGTGSATVTAVLASTSAYKDELMHVLAEPPIKEEDLPPNVPLPEGEFPGGLQNRFAVAAINPFTLEEGGLVTLQASVVTSSGSYTATAEIHAELPWKVASGIRNVPVGDPVLLHGKDQSSYDWALIAPADSSATLTDATSQNPWFTPDVAGEYRVTVTDGATGSQVTMSIFGAIWRGIIVGQDADGRPVADQVCTVCHTQVTEWAQTGHAEIFSDNLNTSSHYSTSCFACHTVGYDPGVANNGFDDAADFQDFLNAGLLNNPSDDNWTTVLDQFPQTAQRANIQCENCHGPQNKTTEKYHFTEAHMSGMGGPRITLSADMCATCHGEPLRHARFQQWQLSGHANYELAISEGSSSTCSKCHTANGFLAWVEKGAAPDASIQVTWTEDEVHPQTCQACHNPHGEGTTTGVGSDATVRISGDTPELLAGFTATDVGRGAICMTCHNSRRGLRNDNTFDQYYGTSEAARAPHGPAQADVLMGQNAYLVPVGQRGYHSMVTDACVACHMEKTPPPDLLSYQQGGTNHTFFASKEICAECHTKIKAEDVQVPFDQKMAVLKGLVENSIVALMKQQIAAGNAIDLNGDMTISNAGDIVSVDFLDSHGRQAVMVTLQDGSQVGPYQLSAVDVVPASGDPAGLYDVANPLLAKAGWNYLLLTNDRSHGVHNPAFVSQVLTASTTALEVLSGATTGGGGGGTAETGGVGAVSCTTPYVYWTEIAAHNTGKEGSMWRTDLVARNTSGTVADVQFVLHRDSGNLMSTSQIAPMAQGVFEDIVGSMGATGKGSLEVCSTQPLEVVNRVFNQSDNGTLGQFLDGWSGGGLLVGQSARLLGLRQETGKYRTNINLTNASTDVATVSITLYATDGTQLTQYEMTVPAGMSVQDLEPFKDRAGQPNLGWGFATVNVVSGQGILASASVIDSQSNDATGIPMKR